LTGKTLRRSQQRMIANTVCCNVPPSPDNNMSQTAYAGNPINNELIAGVDAPRALIVKDVCRNTPESDMLS
jgi:hypothetical protein